jgi:uncharacterized protein YciI
MWYLIYSEDVENSLPLRKQTRAAHLERIQLLVDQGRVLVAGPCPAIDSEDPGEAGYRPLCTSRCVSKGCSETL